MPRVAHKTKLTRKQQEHVVMRLACYDTPTAIAQGLREQFGIEVTRQSIEYYDPTKSAGRAIPRRWKTLFNATRRKVVAACASVGLADKMTRVFLLELMAAREHDAGNTREVRALLQQIAEEMGARDRPPGPHAGVPQPAQIFLSTTRPKDLYHLSDDELMAIASQRRHLSHAPAQGAEGPDRVQQRGGNPRKGGQ